MRPTTLMTKEEAAAYLAITIADLERLAATFELPYYELSRMGRRFRRADVDAWLEHFIKTEPTLFAAEELDGNSDEDHVHRP